MEALKFNSEGVKLIEEIGEIIKTRTQSIKVTMIEKDGKKFVSVQKWWRKSADDAWLEGKGFHLDEKDAESVQQLISKAQLMF